MIPTFMLYAFLGVSLSKCASDIASRFVVSNVYNIVFASNDSRLSFCLDYLLVLRERVLKDYLRSVL